MPPKAWPNRGLPGAFLLGVLFAIYVLPHLRRAVLRQPAALSLTAPTQLPLYVIYGLATAVPVAVVALAVLFGAQAGAKVLGGVQRWQRPLQTVNAWLIVCIGVYLTLSGPLGLV